MITKPITSSSREAFNSVVTHPLQSYEWGEFREKTGLQVIRQGIYDKDTLVDGFQMTVHPIPKTPWTIGYLPKGNVPSSYLIDELKTFGRQARNLFVQLEPNVIKSILSREGKLSTPEAGKDFMRVINHHPAIVPSAHPLFTQYTFHLDLTPSEDTLLKQMHQKARYNIRVSQKHQVTVQEDNSAKAFAEYLRLTDETTTRQGFYAHGKHYHQLQWEMLNHKPTANQLTSHLLTATYQGKTLAAWILFVFKDTLYYPYGASSSEHREVMASSAIMWEAIRFGKKMGLTKFDMWGALGPQADSKDPWFGFHDFKRKYGPDHIEFVGSYDLLLNPMLYQGYKLADKVRWMYLRVKK